MVSAAGYLRDAWYRGTIVAKRRRWHRLRGGNPAVGCKRSAQKLASDVSPSMARASLFNSWSQQSAGELDNPGMLSYPPWCGQRIRLASIRARDEEKSRLDSAKVAAFRSNTCEDFYGALHSESPECVKRDRGRVSLPIARALDVLSRGLVRAARRRERVDRFSLVIVPREVKSHGLFTRLANRGKKNGIR